MQAGAMGAFSVALAAWFGTLEATGVLLAGTPWPPTGGALRVDAAQKEAFEHLREEAPSTTPGGSFRLRIGRQSYPTSVVKAVDLAAIPGGTRITIVADTNTPSKNSATPSSSGSLRGLPGFNITALHLGPNGSAVPSLSVKHPMDLVPLEDIKMGISLAIEEGIKKAQGATSENGTAASIDEIKKKVNEEVLQGWTSLQKTMRANRFRRSALREQPGGILHFFQSVSIVDWIILSTFLALFFALSTYNLCWPGTRKYHAFSLLSWILLAGLYNIVIWQRMDVSAGVLWLNGYIFELVFLVENVLVCHIVIHAFKMPKWVNEKALVIVVIVRLVFQMVFYMGFAQLVFSGQALPYFLGVWLLVVAYQSATGEPEGFDIMDTRVVYLARAAFGDRLSLSKDESGALLVTRDGKTRLSIAGLLVVCLVSVDFLLHIDVALTKIQELQGNAFLCFSSAAAASFCMPELIFVTRELFRRFPGLRYGMSFILVYISMQMLLHAVWWPPVSMDLVIWVGVLVVSAAIPVGPQGTLNYWQGKPKASVDAGTQSNAIEKAPSDDEQ